MAKSHAIFGVVHCLGVFLSLTEDGTQLQFKLTLHMHLLHPLRNVNVFEEIGLIENLDRFFQINDAFFKHSELLEAHGHVVIRDVGEILISLTVLEIDNLKYTLSLLQEHIGFLVLVFFDEFVGNVSKF